MLRKYILLLLLLILPIGCATVSEKPKGETLFYPPLPDEPRIQYLTSFSTSKDIEGETGGFAKFVLGESVTIKPIVKPYGVKVHDGKIYVCDTVNNSIDILDLEKKTFEYFQIAGSGQLLDPINLDIASDGRMFVADSRRGQVIIFSDEGKYLTAIGSKGEFKPTDVAIRDNRIFVCDLKSHSVRVFDQEDNSFLYSIPKEGQEKEAALYSPTNLDIDSSGNIYVSDVGNFRVKKYTPEGIFLKSFGSQGDAPGRFARPKGVAVDHDERVYIVDAAFENVQIFDREGQLLVYFPENQDGASLVLPAGIAIDYDHVQHFQKLAHEDFEIEYLVIVSSQYGGRKISVFGFGKKK